MAVVARGRTVCCIAASTASSKSVMIVESPTKAIKIQKFLGDDYKVLASYGHVRDLSPKSGSVIPEHDFDLVWEVSKGGSVRLKELADAAKGVGHVLFATDPDREGEAISWHVMEELKRRGVLTNKQVSRITFTELTKDAVATALASPRQLSFDLVNAYLARRSLDYLVGYTLSPLLWRRLSTAARSAGRVQSVALRMISDRESDIERFHPQEYWTISVVFVTPDGISFTARLTAVDGQKLGQLSISDQQAAQQMVDRIRTSAFEISSKSSRPTKRSPPAPFVTSTLQQEASRRLGFSAVKTMMIAQELYEGKGAGKGVVGWWGAGGGGGRGGGGDEIFSCSSSQLGAAVRCRVSKVSLCLF
eukprot:jgi/Chrzof1/12208/Cz06g25110.t1